MPKPFPAFAASGLPPIADRPLRLFYEHLRHEPTKTGRSRIKRLRGLSRPQYRLRADDIRVFYDVTEKVVEILAIVSNEQERPMKTVALNEVKDDLSRYLHLAEKEEIVITRHGKPAGVLIGFASEDDWFDYRLEHDPRFLQRVERARQSLRAGQGVKFEDIEA